MSNASSFNVFLGSSITELKDERVRISDSISQDLTYLFKQDGIRIQVPKCESIHEGNDGTPDQDKIDEMLCECDGSLFLFKDKEGEITLHEYEIARAIQKAKNHKIYVYYLRDGEANKSERLTPFQERLKQDGVHWKVCDNLSDLKYQFAMGLLMDLGVHCGDTVRAASEVKKNGEDLFEQCQQDHQLMHQEIEKLLSQIDPVMNDTDTPIAARITHVLGLYQKADLWASKTDYDKEKYLQILYKYGKFLFKYSQYSDSVDVLSRHLSMAQENNDNNRFDLFGALTTIGKSYDRMGKYQNALQYHKKALHNCKKRYGKSALDVAKILNNIGDTYYHMGKNIWALLFLMKSKKIYVQFVEQPTSQYAADVYNSIGLVLVELHLYRYALIYHTTALKIDCEIFGDKNSHTGADYNNIGEVYKHLHIFPTALSYFNKSEMIKKEIFEAEHPSIAITYFNKGEALYGLKRYSEALSYFNMAKSIFECSLGDYHQYSCLANQLIDKTKSIIGTSF